MKKVILLLNCILSISLINAGVCADTVVETPEGLKEIKILKVGDMIFCCNANLQHETGSVITVQEIEATSVVEITMTDGVTISVAADQKLFVTHKWVQANQLTLEDVLYTKDHTFVGITSIRHLQKSMTLRFITIDKNPTFWAAENGVLIHNGPWAAYIAYTTTKASLLAAAGLAVAGTVIVAAPVAGGMVSGTIVGGIATGGGTIVIGGAGAVAVATPAMATAMGAVSAGVGTISTIAGASTTVTAGAGAIATASTATLVAIEAISMAAFTAAMGLPTW